MKPTHIGLYMDMIPKESILFKWHCEIMNMPTWNQEFVNDSRQTIRLFLN